MAFIKITAGPEKIVGKEIVIPINPRDSQEIFISLSIKRCFWEVEFSNLNKQDAFELMIIDFATRCARAICMGVPILIDKQKIIVLSMSKKSVDNALHKVVNLLAVSGGSMRVVKDDRDGLEIETIFDDKDDDFAEGMFFANA